MDRLAGVARKWVMKEVVFKPRIDVVDTSDAFEVTLELPGVDMRDVKTTLRQGVLTIEGEKKRRTSRTQTSNLALTERNFGWFRREVTLAVRPEQSTFESQFEKGVLKVTIGKAMRPSPKEALFRSSREKPKGFLRSLLSGRKTQRRPYPYFDD
jgi:HSP20 family molecular chaperone IbpA